MSHTPAPWFADEPNNWHGVAARISSEKPYAMIAQVQYAGWSPKSIAKANARLIAAAPELLEVVRLLLRVADLDDADDRLLALDENSPLIDAARAAFAKATGDKA